MKVVQARKAGFCFGVKRAIELAEQESAKGPICSWGPLIHNAQVVKSLEAKGVTVVNSLEEVDGGKKLVIRSHGAPPLVFSESDRLGIEIVDATCPFVNKAQARALEASKSGFVVIVGDPQHPEVQGLLGWAGNSALVVSNLNKACQLPHYPKLSVIAQTTLSRCQFDAITAELKNHSDNLIVYDTICLATHERQEAAAELAEKSDLMIVVGSQTSSNTRQLAEICAKKTTTHLIDTADELQDTWFHGCRTAGLTAGASTPDWIIEEVYTKMSEEFNTQEIAATDSAPVQDAASEQEASALDIASTQDAAPVQEPDSAQELTSAQEVSPVQDTVPTQESVPAPTVAADPEPAADSFPEESMADEDFSDTMEGYAGSLPKLYKGALVSGAVVKISSDEVFIDISWKSEGVIPLAELAFTKVSRAEDVVKLGDMISAVVLRVENEEGHPILSKRRAAEMEAREFLAKAFAGKEEIHAKVMECVKGGLLVDLGMRGFVPASQIQPGFVEDLSIFIGQDLRLRILEYDEAKKKLVLSQKVILNEEADRKRAQILVGLNAGDVVEGVVQRLTKFGAFVDIGGVDALLHISDMAFSRIQHPSEVVNVNDTIKVKILSIDSNAGKVSLGLKQLKTNPWDNIAAKYAIDSNVEGTVVRIAPFGAFVQLEDGIDALIHISQLATHRIPKVEDVVTVGQTVTAKVIECRPGEKRMSLSIRDYLLEQNPALAAPQENPETPEISEAAPQLLPAEASLSSVQTPIGPGDPDASDLTDSPDAESYVPPTEAPEQPQELPTTKEMEPLGAESPDAEPPDAEPSDAEPSGAESSDAEPSDAESSGAEPSDAETHDAETHDAETPVEKIPALAADEPEDL